MEILDHVQLIYVDVIANNNKVWKATLYDDGTVKTEWGRVREEKSLQFKNFYGRGRRFFDSKKNEKLRHGYTELKVLNSQKVTTKNINNDLISIARSQIAGDNTVLIALVDKLVNSNIHQITSSTNIKYNTDTGLFSTPLGIVTNDAILEARN